MANYITHKVSKGIVQDGGSGNTVTWWKTNFNMPVPEIWDGTWVKNRGPFTYEGLATSFNLTDLKPGYEIALFTSLWYWDGPLSGTAYIYSQWKDESNNLIYNCANGNSIDINVASGYWQEYAYACNTGVAGWEVDVAGNYKVRSWSTGTGAISQTDTTVAFSNVPNTSQLDSSKAGYIWVENNDLCFICANRWKHTIQGGSLGYVDTAKAGYLWIDTNNYLCWVGTNGYGYRVIWRIKQFASTFSDGATNEVFAGTSKAGFTWVDNEFGETHLSYIGYDGYKYLTGAGNYPYQAPY